MVCQFQCNIVYDMKSLLKMISGPEHLIMINRPAFLFFSNCGRMHHYATCLFLIVSAVPTSKTSHHNAAECTIKRPRFQNILSSYKFQRIVSNTARNTSWRPWFQKFLRSSNFQIITSNSVRLYRLASLISTFSQQFQFFSEKDIPEGLPNPRSFSYFE